MRGGIGKFKNSCKYWQNMYKIYTYYTIPKMSYHRYSVRCGGVHVCLRDLHLYRPALWWDQGLRQWHGWGMLFTQFFQTSRGNFVILGPNMMFFSTKQLLSSLVEIPASWAAVRIFYLPACISALKNSSELVNFNFQWNLFPDTQTEIGGTKEH